ncbi:major facilitator superfamily domain-containing protein [Thermothelomyces heterothallicus CBS 202.75]|uniref:major facilitator superfamily domain-containing protein n=1 Tax=Thermothelomyces heterothallicus CBS 202.75 TaxID=1149848 RepID=UPI003743F63B
MQAAEWYPRFLSLPLPPSSSSSLPASLLADMLVIKTTGHNRLPVLFYSQLFSLAATVGATLAPSYGAFTAFRALQGFAGAPPQVLGLCVVHDLFFAPDRARKVNLWAASFLVGPYLGPLLSGLLALRLGWRDDFAVLAGLYALSVVVVAALGDETLFVRAGMPARCAGGGRAEREKGVNGGRASSSSLWGVWRNQCSLLARPYLLLPTALFITPITMWTIGMVMTVSQFVLPPVSAGGYGFSTVALSMLHFSPIVGTVLAEAWGHWFNDFLAARHMARFGPECRLTATYPAVLVGAAGLVLFGQTLDHHLSWVGLAFGWAMLCFSTLANMTAVSAYLLDCLPRQAALTAAWLNFARVVGGFSVAYFQMPWFHRNGPALSFGLQAVVMVGATLAVLATQIWGRTWRVRFPAPRGGEGTA